MKNFIYYLAIVLIALVSICLLQIIPNFISSNDNRFYIGIALLCIAPYIIYISIIKIIKKNENENK